MTFDIKKFLKVFMAALNAALEDGKLTKEDIPRVVTAICTEILKDEKDFK